MASLTDTIANTVSDVVKDTRTAAERTANDVPVSNRKTKLTDSFREHFSGDAPLVDKARGFAKERPWTSAALAGVAAIAVLNTLRGKQL